MSDTMTQDFTQSFDAQAWARAFVEHVERNPSIATSEATMIGWFANALMRGYDEHARRATAPDGARRPTTDELTALVDAFKNAIWDAAELPADVDPSYKDLAMADADAARTALLSRLASLTGGARSGEDEATPDCYFVLDGDGAALHAKPHVTLDAAESEAAEERERRQFAPPPIILRCYLPKEGATPESTPTGRDAGSCNRSDVVTGKEIPVDPNEER